MEDSLTHLPHTFSQLIEKQKALLAAAAEKAGRQLEYDAAHDKEILVAIGLVEKFLRAKRRVCYGGQAINAHLPLKHKFYDPETTIPDYDFLTPDSKSDLEDLTAMLKDEGFADIGVRPGMHEGTTKVYVNYTPVADVTEINPVFYSIISKRAIKKAGIYYMDPNTLRMMIYLELSRPRGEVERWEKVYERLMLLNTYAPLKGCRLGSTKQATKKVGRLPSELRSMILDFIISEQRILCGGDVIDYYSHRLRSKANPVHWLLGGRSPVLFYSERPDDDVAALQRRADGAFTFKKFAAVAEFFPPIYMGYMRGTTKPVVAIIQTTACHSYNSVSLNDGRRIFLASFDTLITLYLSFLFRSTLEAFFGRPILCLVERVMTLQAAFRKDGKSPFPFISIECMGHQKTYQSLLREKVERIRKERATASRNTRRQRSRRRRSGSGKSRTLSKRGTRPH
jgi:hypothetical protein